MHRSTLVVIPAKDERKTVAAVVSAVIARFGMRVLVVDDGSGDDTAARAREAGAEVLCLAVNLGAWGATQAGIRYALSKGFERVLTMDADGQHPPECLQVLLDSLNENDADLVIGSCLSRGSVLRHIAWTFFRQVTGLAVKDLTSGLRIYNKRAMQIAASPAASLLDYQDIGVLVLMVHDKLKVREIQVPMCRRENGCSRVFNTWFAVAEYMVVSSVLSLSKTQKHRALKRNP